MKYGYKKSISYANTLLDELGIQRLDDINDFESIFKKKNISLRFASLTGCLGRTQHLYGKPLVTISNQIRNLARLLFTMAHELGHIVLGHGLTSHKTPKEILGIYPKKEIDTEAEVNIFAAHFLVPDRFLQPIIESENPSMTLIDEISELFGVSKLTAGFRYIDISNEPVAFLVSSKKRNRLINFSKSSYLEKEGLYIPYEIPSQSILRKLMNARNLSDSWHDVFASEWFSNKHIDALAMVKEWSRYDFKFDRGMTLLFVDDELYDD